MTIALKPAKQHSYRLSAYERNENDFYPTPSDLATSLPFGLSQLGLDLPRVALDPCGGDGALRGSLAPFGVDVRLSDLYPERYPEADGDVTTEPLDAAQPEQLRCAFELAGAVCTAIITNTPHNNEGSVRHRFESDRFVVGALDGSRGPKKARCMLTRGTSGGRRQGAAHL
jgi:hypothetical protein